MISGLPELADEIFASRRAKGSVAYVSNQCASAAFWLGAQATRIIAQPSSDIGSVGVMCVHFDCSQQLAAEGIRPTIIASTPHKSELSPLVALTPVALQHEQGRVDSLHSDFVLALARGRCVDAASVRRDFGGGRVLNAREARRVGMIDGIAPSLPDALSRMPAPARRSSSAASSSGSSRAQMQRAAPHMTRRPDPIVEVFAPSNAPHLARIAVDLETQLLRHIETLPTDALRRLLREGEAIAERRRKFERFLRRAGVR